MSASPSFDGNEASRLVVSRSGGMVDRCDGGLGPHAELFRTSDVCGPGPRSGGKMCTALHARRVSMLQ